MSLYAMQKAIFDLKRDKQRAALLRTAPLLALQGAELTHDELSAMTRGDLATLYLMGVHPLLLAPYSRMLGISRSDYQRALAPLKGKRRFSSDLRPDDVCEA